MESADQQENPGDISEDGDNTNKESETSGELGAVGLHPEPIAVGLDGNGFGSWKYTGVVISTQVLVCDPELFDERNEYQQSFSIRCAPGFYDETATKRVNVSGYAGIHEPRDLGFV
jgi:hypothetical protein